MVRPKKHRFIGKRPETDYFKPRGIPLSSIEEVNLTVEEYEAIRLSDYENYSQNKCASLMNVSQPTFSRILDSGRSKIADAISHGKALRIEGGVFKMVKRIFQCYSCGNEWNVDFGTGRPSGCPECGSLTIHRINMQTKRLGRQKKRGKGYGKRHRGRGKGRSPNFQ